MPEQEKSTKKLIIANPSSPIVDSLKIELSDFLTTMSAIANNNPDPERGKQLAEDAINNIIASGVKLKWSDEP